MYKTIQKWHIADKIIELRYYHIDQYLVTNGTDHISSKTYAQALKDFSNLIDKTIKETS